ncbi:MAG: hypothetical protein ACPF9D_01420 [Owenweeksia sp.]
MRTAEADLKEIKNLMERSSRFISLSGLSGVFAGLYALAGAWLADQYVTSDYERIELWPLVAIAATVLFLSLITAIFFTTRNARKKNQKIWDKLSQRMLWNLAVPLIAGGLFLVILIVQKQYYLVAPGMLVFYGLALINGSKYTLNDIRYVGYFQIILGLLATWFYGNGLLFWSIGFGWLHIIYGALMYWKYER